MTLRFISRLLLFVLVICISFASQAQEGTFTEHKYMAGDGVERPYVVYTGQGVRPGERRPLIVYLHGAISSQALPNIERSSRRSVMNKLADEGGYYILYVFGQRGAGWFDRIGTEMILGELEAVKATYPIDSDRVFLGGFSDGASGTLYMATTCPTPFAGFIALNGSISVAANLGTSPVYVENLNGRPLYVVNTLSDFLYPVKMMQPTVDYMRRYHSGIIYRTPEGNHDPRYFPTLQGEVRAFVDSCVRRTPTVLSWETSDSISRTFEWLTIDSLRSEEPASWHRPYHLMLTNDKASLGVSPSATHVGRELVIGGFGKKSVLRDIGLSVGDTVTHLDTVALIGPRELFGYTASRRAGDRFTVTVLRGGQPVVLDAQFPPAYDYEVFEKQPLSGKVRARLEGDKLTLETSRVARLTIDLDCLPLGRRRRLTIDLNGHRIVLRKPHGLHSLEP